MVGLQTLNLTMVVRSHPPQPKKRSLSEMDITEVYETSSPSSTLGETATSTHGETDITEVFETSGPGSTPGGCTKFLNKYWYDTDNFWIASSCSTQQFRELVHARSL